MKHIQVLSAQDTPVVIDHSGEYRVEINKPGASVTIIGLFRAIDAQNVSVNLTIIHRAPHTHARTILKGVAEDTSSIHFFGRIIIESECGNTQSFLEERILLLSDKAKAEAIPELEIHTDDVKCSHAASISRIPEEHLFYLQSRGVSKRKAEEMIIEGFLTINNS